ncbi:MAG: SOS response-associated peptidase [Bacteroidales bacterium]|nr:SOS response-associated peptidase [Bacteroidales bacterium]
MCFHYALSKTSQELRNRYNAKSGFEKEFKPVYHANGFSFQELPVITAENPDTIQFYKWGLIPIWTKNTDDALKIRAQTLNAKSETIFEKPSFRYSITAKRCLVPSTGFFEWHEFKNKKYPYFITLKNNEIFSLAGIYENWTNKSTGEIFNTFSIITTKANSLVEKIHNTKKRMPVILSHENEDLWLKLNLKRGEIENLTIPFDSSKMKAYTVSKLVSTKKENSNVPEVTKEYFYQELKS